MMNLGKMMKQAQEMQTRMQEMQDQLSSLEITGASGGGMVVATLNGKGEMRKLEIDPGLMKPEEKEVVEDLVTAAVNDARAKVDAMVQEKTQEMMGGLQLPPGMKLPF